MEQSELLKLDDYNDGDIIITDDNRTSLLKLIGQMFMCKMSLNNQHKLRFGKIYRLTQKEVKRKLKSGLFQTTTYELVVVLDAIQFKMVGDYGKLIDQEYNRRSFYDYTEWFTNSLPVYISACKDINYQISIFDTQLKTEKNENI